MSRKENAPGARAGRLESHLSAGDHRAAGLEARAVLSDPEATAEERARAGSVLASLLPEPMAVILGAVGALGGAALAVWLSAGGGR